ncbi:MAG: hypothetical protein NC097_07815 [Clostridium sp.]|nr:hypothetical protein [Prevotella sp.]MCM1429685.1 hypothetical protein [Clostridium sp.]
MKTDSQVPTPWSVRLHPRRAISEILELREKLVAATAAREESLEIALRQARDNEAAMEENADKRAKLAAKLRQLEAEAQQRDQELHELRSRLEDYGNIRHEIAEFEKKLGDFESVRQGYELRISTMQMQLDDARRRLREASDTDIADAPATINMKARRINEKDPSGWFRTLPDEL